MNQSVRSIARRVLATLLALTGVAAAQEADPNAFRVVTVPWVGTTPRVPHDGVDGQWHYFQAVARGTCDEAIQYRWDFDGDGTWDTAFVNAANRWNLGAKHTLPAQGQDRLFVARVQGKCGAALAEAEFPLRMRANPTRAQKVNRAVSNGLWYGHINLIRDPNLRQAHWGDRAGRHWIPDTAMLAQAMMNRGHVAGVNGEIDPLIEDGQWMLHAVLSASTQQAIGVQAGGVNPDVNGNGYAVRFEIGDGHDNYSQGPALEALASWGDMDYVIPADVGAPANFVAGRRLGDVVNDAAEFFYWSMTDIAFDGGYAGGWDYSVNSNAIDTSQVGWVVVGLYAAEVNAGVQVPQWVKNRVLKGAQLTNIGRFDAAKDGSYVYRGDPAGGDRSGNLARSGAMLTALGFALGGERGHPLADKTAKFIGDNFDVDLPIGWGARPIAANNLTANYYALFQIAKGSRSFTPAYDRLGAASLDWYARIGDFLVNTADANGTWTNDNMWMGGRKVQHAISLLILIPTVFDIPPVAVASAEPALAGPGDEITFAHAGSYAADPTSPIVRWRWNFIDLPGDDTDGDGTVEADEIVWEIDTNDANLRPRFAFNPAIAFGEEKSYRILLEVEDSQGRKATDAESVVVKISLINHAPVVVSHPSGISETPYRVSPGGRVTLNASQSFDPDSDDAPNAGSPADTITSIAWDLDFDGTFETVGAQVQFDAPAAWQIGQSRVIRVKACDDGRWVGQTDAECGGDCSQCSEGVAHLEIANDPPVAAVALGAAFVLEGGELVADASGSTDDGALTYAWSCDAPLETATEQGGALLRISAANVDAPGLGVALGCTLTVTDTAGQTDEQAFQVTVRNAAPVIDGVALVDAAVEGGLALLRVTARDPAAADELLYGADCDDDGLFEVAGQAASELACAFEQDGIYPVAVIVTDDDGDSATTAVDVHVENAAPAIAGHLCPAVREGEAGVISVQTSDPADPVRCALAAPVPGAMIDADSCRIFWVPSYAQARDGGADFHIVATDVDGGRNETDFRCAAAPVDDDGDGLADTWEREHGTQLGGGDCDADLDGDGLTNCDEFARGTDPRRFDGATPPVLESPADGAVVRVAELVAWGATDALGGDIRYRFFVYDGADDIVPRVASPLIDAQQSEGHFTALGLEENATYYWTARGHNGRSDGPAAARIRFALNAVDERPTAPAITEPVDGGEVASLRPAITVEGATDADPGDTLRHECEITSLLLPEAPVFARGPGPVLTPASPLTENGDYGVRCRAIDAAGLTSPWSALVHFRVDALEEAPGAPQFLDPARGTTIHHPQVALVAGDAHDPDGDALTYAFWFSNDPTFSNATTIASGELPADEANRALFAVARELRDGETWYWKARASDGRLTGPSVVNTLDVRLIGRPLELLEPVAAIVDTDTPDLIVRNGADPAGRALRYEFAIFTDAEGGELVATSDLVDEDAGTTSWAVPPGLLREDATYYWTARAHNGLAASPFAPLAAFTIDAVAAAPGAPTIRRPERGDVVAAGQPEIEIGAAADSDPAEFLRYGCEIATDAAFADVVSGAEGEPGRDGRIVLRSAAPLAENGRFFVRCRAVDRLGMAGPWSASSDFMVNGVNEAPSAPRALAPARAAILNTRRIVLEAGEAIDPEGAPLTYRFWISTEPTFGEDTLDSGELEAPTNGRLTWSPTLTPRNGTTLYWRVRAHDGMVAGPATTSTFGIDVRRRAPVLAEPVGGAVVDDASPRLSVRVGGLNDGVAPRYVITVYADEALTRPVASSDPLPGGDELVGWTLPDGALEENHTYWWTARAYDGVDFGDAAAPESFTVNAIAEAPAMPRVLAPQAGDAVDSARPEIVAGGSDPDPGDALTLHCEVLLADDERLVAAHAEASAGLDGVARVPLADALDENGDYLVRCRATDRAGMSSPWSDAVPFTVNADNEAPPAPRILAPAQDAVLADDKPDFVVAGVADPEGEPVVYRFRLSRDPMFPLGATFDSEDVLAGPDGTVTWQAPAALGEDTTWYWGVRAHDPHTAGMEVTGRFRIDMVNEAPSAPRALNPAAGAVSEPDPRFIWGASVDPEGAALAYQVELCGTADCGDLRWTVTTSDQYADYPQRLPEGIYYWRVRSFDAGGESSAWTIATMFRVEPDVTAPPAGQPGRLDLPVRDIDPGTDLGRGGHDLPRLPDRDDERTPDAGVGGESPDPGEEPGHAPAQPEDEVPVERIEEPAERGGCSAVGPESAPAAPLFLLALAALRRRRR